MFVPEKDVTHRDIVLAEERLAALVTKGDPQELGLAHLKLAHLYKHAGPIDGRHPFVASAESAKEALRFLRQADDRKNLAKALRASVVAFVTDADPDAQARLEEALQISEELGDPEDIGWSHHALWTHCLRTQKVELMRTHRARVIEVWKDSGQDMLVADALFQQALQNTFAPDQADLYHEAGVRFERVRVYRNAALAFNMAAMAGEERGWDRVRIRQVLRRQILNEQRSTHEVSLRGAKMMLRRYRRHNRGLKRLRLRAAKQLANMAMGNE